jgi:hypothetical protein
VLCCEIFDCFTIGTHRIITGQIFDARSLAYVVLVLPSYSIVLTNLKLNFLAAMNISFQYSLCDILLPLSFLLSYQPVSLI